MSIIDLKDKHVEETIYVVGKGESIKNLSVDYFANGPVIALNHAIIKVNDLKLSNVVYSMQKDGNHGGRRKCKYPNCYNCKDFCVDPSPAILLVHEHESKLCFENYKPRYVFDNTQLGLRPTDFSALTCIQLAKNMGCNKIIFLCFDAINGDYSRVNLENNTSKINLNYKTQINIQQNYLKDIEHEYITPSKI